MYVCFGFSLARLSRARTIDLQCQSLSLRRAFLLRSVCLSCMSVSRSRARFRRARTVDLQCQSLSLRRAFLLRSVCLSVRLTVKSRPVCLPTRLQNQSKKQPKSTEDRSPEMPRGTQNRLKIAAWILSGDPVACKSVPKASPERLGSVPERPRRPPGVPGGSPRAPRNARKGRPGAPGSAPRRPKSMPSRVREQKNRVVLARFARRLIFIRFLLDFDRFSDVRASRSGSALAAKFDQFSVRACEARPSRNTAHSDEFEGRPF